MIVEPYNFDRDIISLAVIKNIIAEEILNDKPEDSAYDVANRAAYKIFHYVYHRSDHMPGCDLCAKRAGEWW